MLARGARSLALALLLGLASPASAQESLVITLSDADRDGDGRIQRAEAPIAVLADFDAIDEDGDGSLDSFEIWSFDQEQLRREASEPGPTAGAAPGQPGVRRAASYEDLVRARDRNGDGRLALDEVPQSMQILLLELDVDGDRAVDLEEARRMDRRREAAREGQGQGRAAPGGGLGHVVRRMDTNGDGILQRREAPLRLQRRFERFDRNGDGAIDPAEAAAADAAAREAAGSAP